jgi:hypothetical protein
MDPIHTNLPSGNTIYDSKTGSSESLPKLRTSGVVIEVLHVYIYLNMPPISFTDSRHCGLSNSPLFHDRTALIS